MPWNPETGVFYQDPMTVVDSSPAGDTVKEGFEERNSPAIVDIYEDLNLIIRDGVLGPVMPATTESRGIARIATSDEANSGKTGDNGPAFLTPETGSMPRGGIIMWSGDIASIPSGWALCDGENGTPNMQGMFVIGAGSDYAVGDTGGTASNTHTIVVDNTTLAVSQMPVHGHTFGPHAQNVSPGSGRQGMPEGSTYLQTGSAGGSGAHGHTATSDTQDNLPPYYALAYIMKI